MSHRKRIGMAQFEEDNIDPYQAFQIPITLENIPVPSSSSIHSLNSLKSNKTSFKNFLSKDEIVQTPQISSKNIQSVRSMTSDQLKSSSNSSQRKMPYEFDQILTAHQLLKSARFHSNELGRPRKAAPQLKRIIQKQKINNLVKTFAQKLKRNNCHSSVPEKTYQFEQSNSDLWFQREGITINQTLEQVFDVVILVLYSTLTYFFTLDLVFPVDDYPWFTAFQIFGLLLVLIQIILGFTATKMISGERTVIIKDIASSYFYSLFFVDLILVITLILDLTISDSSIVNVLKMVILLKIPSCFDRLQRLEANLISTTYKQQYWSLIKLFIFNFCYAHLLALMLKSMAGINPSKNWISVRNLSSASWFEVYVWSYYWAVNIMLTVGFGDIAATTYQQAICLIFFETISCMVLAYNINLVGSLITNIRAQDIQKGKKYKIFRNLSKKNQLSNDLNMQISSYIQESANIKKKFNIQEQTKFIQSLPKNFKTRYHKQSNKSIFQKLYFFSTLADKAILSLAQDIEISITHPEEIIISNQNFNQLKILKEGKIGYCCQKPGCNYNGQVVNEITVRQKDNPFLMALNFLSSQIASYAVKSIEYSVTYGLSYQNLISSLKNSKGDYQYFCFLKDKAKNILDEFEVIKCENCNVNHTQFNCPKQHFVPIVQHVINKYLFQNSLGSCQRSTATRKKKALSKVNAASYFKTMNQKLNKDQKCAVPNGKTIIAKGFIVRQLSKVQQISQEELQANISQINLQQFKDVLSDFGESLRLQMNSLLKHEKIQDEVWIVWADSMQNYKCYFPDENPCGLSEREDLQPKMPVKDENQQQEEQNSESDQSQQAAETSNQHIPIQVSISQPIRTVASFDSNINSQSEA